MTALFTLVVGLAAGWWIEHRRHQATVEQAHYDEFHREDFDRLAHQVAHARYHWRDSLGIARRTRQRTLP